MQPNADTYDAIETRYGFRPPDEYRRMQAQGWCDVKRVDDVYLWLLEAEWYSLEEILHYEFEPWHKPGFVPFAFTGAGDLWCWYPERSTELGTPVVLCPHDFEIATIDAPDFIAWLYRRVLEYAVWGFDAEDEEEARAEMNRWRTDLGPFFPGEWNQTIEALCQAPLKTWTSGNSTECGFLLPEEYENIVKRDLAFPGLNQESKWMLPSC